MAQSDTSAFEIIAKSETVWGETPSGGTWDYLRITGESLDRNKEEEVSKEIQSHAQDTDIIQVGASTSGDLNFDLTWGTWDTWFEALLRKTAVTVSYTASTISAASADNSINDSAVAFPATIVVGMWVRIAGFTGTAANNATAEVVSVTTAKIVVKDGTNGGVTFVNDAEGEAVTITAKMIRCGTTLKSLVVEKRFTDVTQYKQYNGLRVEKFSLSIPAKGLITGSFGVVGKQATRSGSSVVGGGSINSINTQEVFSASGNVAYMREGGTTLTTIVKEIKIDVANNTGPLDQVASIYPANYRMGKFAITGTIDAYFEDGNLLDKFLADTESSFHLKLSDDNGKVIVFSFPRMKYTKSSVLAEGENSSVMVKLAFRAFRHTTLLTSMQIDIL